MSTSQQKIVRYLEEARATEESLVRVLQSHIEIAPDGPLRAVLEQHLAETRGHAERVQSRIDALESRSTGSPVRAWLGLTETVIGQTLALGKAPLDALRGASDEEKVLKAAKDDCATEALEIATYTAIERLARVTGDQATAQLAASILADERRMLDRLLEEIPSLAAAVAGVELGGAEELDAALTDAAHGVAGTVRDATRTATETSGAAAEAAADTAAAVRRSTAGTTKAAGESTAAATKAAGESTAATTKAAGESTAATTKAAGESTAATTKAASDTAAVATESTGATAAAATAGDAAARGTTETARVSRRTTAQRPKSAPRTGPRTTPKPAGEGSAPAGSARRRPAATPPERKPAPSGSRS